MNILYRRVALNILLIIIVAILATPIQVNAQLGPYVWFSANSSVSACSAQGFTIPLIITYTVSAQGASYREVDSLNGQIVYQATGTTDFKGSSINTPSLGYKTTKIQAGGFPTKEPYTYVTDYTFSGYGRVILTLTCDGGGPTVGVTNNATLLDDNSRPVATQYFVDFSYLGGATCDTTGFKVPNLITYWLPDKGARFHEADSLNGQTVYTTTTGTTTYSKTGVYHAIETQSGGFPAALPYTYSSMYGFVFHNVISFYDNLLIICDQNSQATVRIINHWVHWMP